MHVAHIEDGPLAVQAAGPEGGAAPLVGELADRVGLVDDLRQLAATEDEVDRAADALGVDQVGDAAQIVGVLEAHALLGGALELEEALAELLRLELVDRAEAAVAHFFFSSRRRHTRSLRDWSSDVCSSD